jgi:hypothetical protein
VSDSPDALVWTSATGIHRSILEPATSTVASPGPSGATSPAPSAVGSPVAAP